MTQDMMTLRALLEKSSDADLLREMIGFTAERLMALEVEGLTGAGHGERSADRITHRNGYRDRSWETRAGTVELKIPKLRKGSYFPGFLEPPTRIQLKNHPELNEKWVQNIIADDPSVLGLGDLVLRDVERVKPRAGRLDFLLQESETQRRYEVELQLGPTDEAHIIRTIEYWDIEKKRYPQYDHCAVLIAEDITSRFHNVISLFNGTMPLIAIQMQALEVGNNLTLVFAQVLNELSRGLVDEDEDADAEPTDRAYWEKRATKTTVGLADQMLEILRGFDPTLNLKFNKFYIGLEKNSQTYNFVTFRPKKNQLNFEIKLPQTDDLDIKIDDAGLDTLEYNKNWGSTVFG